MKPNDTYVGRHDVNLVNEDDIVNYITRGHEYKATSFSTVVDTLTGEVINLPLHVARNSAWYFTQPGFGQHIAQPEVTQSEYVAAIVRGNEGMDAGELYRVMQSESFAPYGGKEIPYNGFTTLLSKDTGIEMRKGGVPVKGVKHGCAGCTYHVKKRVA